MAGHELVFDDKKYRAALIKELERSLKKIGDNLLKKMADEIESLSTFSSDHRRDVLKRLKNRLAEKTDVFIQQSVGLVDVEDNDWDMIKAMILDHGTGSRGEEGSGPIWHYDGVPGLNNDVTGWHTTKFPKKDYKLPDGFNMEPGHWFENACKLIDEIFDDEMDEMMKKVNPLDYLKMR